jgi:hypothetical protein
MLVEVHVNGQSVQHRHLQDDDPGCRRRCQGHRGGIGEVMNNQVPRYVTQARASFLLGIPEAEFRRISKESGLGHVERAGNEEETYFTYEELQRICKLAAHQTQAVH